MTENKHLSPRARLLSYLTACYTIFIVYVSLTPFANWQEQGLSFYDVLMAPLGQTYTTFDFILNCLSYLPLGFLLAYKLRKHFQLSFTIIFATLIGVFLSVILEYAQMYLPSRVSSNTDLLSNTLGTLLGAAFACFIARHSWISLIGVFYEKWLKLGITSDMGVVLIALWVFAQTNPSLPMLGSVFVSEVARWPFDIVPESPFDWLECAEVSLNLLLVGILLSTLLHERRYTLKILLLLLSVVILIKFISAAVLLKSWALLVWINSEAVLGILAGVTLLTLVLRLSSSKLLWLGTLSTLSYIALLQFLLLDSKPSAALRIYHWHYIHMLNYNGFSQLVILLFPILLLVYLWRTGVLRK